jgi:hypothetical protein
MNHFSYESMGKDKIKHLQQEGMRSQASHGDHNFIRSPKFILLLLIALGLLSIFWH